MKLELTLPELWGLLTLQYVLLGIPEGRCDLSVMKQVYKGIHTLQKEQVRQGERLEQWVVECSDADLLHLARYVTPDFSVGSVVVGKNILLKVFGAMYTEEPPPEPVKLDDHIETVLKEALHDDYYARKSTDESTVTTPDS